jgi:hypothetical protein
MRRRYISPNALLLLASLTIGLVLSETAARLFLSRADYLSATTIGDEILGLRVAPGTGGFDGWGFRNAGVPQSVEILALGDSHTYGNNATLSDSWPSVVGRRTRQSVYNLGLGGYGPNQYYHLLTARGLKLKPRWVLCGLYMGDDFENAFVMTYGKEYWTFLRGGSWSGVAVDIWETPDQTTWHRSVRAWLSRNSMIYQLLVHGPLLGKIKGALQVRQAALRADQTTTSLVLDAGGVVEAFRPRSIHARLDQSSAAVREGMRITFHLLALMDKTCQENGCQLVVVVIPTKETVFADYLLRDRHLPLRDVISDLVHNEEDATRRLLNFLDQANIPYVETLPALRRKVSDQLYTHSDKDMHPGKNGYKVIGETVAEFLGGRLLERRSRAATAAPHPLRLAEPK